MNAPIVFVDTETTGLDPERHEVWEIALIGRETLNERVKPKRLDLADPNSLRLTRYYDRIATETPDGFFTKRTRNQVAWDVVRLTAGQHLVGAVPSFDARFLEAFVRAEGYTPAWHYHLIDVETLVAGHLSLEPPLDSETLSRTVGVDPDNFDRHTAFGDAQWAQAMYRAVCG